MPLSDYDKKVIEAGYNYIPRTEFLLNPFKIPENESVTTTDEAGISTLIPRDSSDGSNPYNTNPYNTNMSTVRQDFNPYEARQAAEIYSRTFNPRSFDPSGEIKDAQVMYNRALQDINDPRPGAKGLNARTETFSGQPRLSQEVLDYYGEKILDNQERYRTEGQYVDPYDPRYSSMTEAQKFMDNYPEYYGVPSGVPETGIPAAIKSYMQNSLIGKGLGAAKGFVENVLPFNERAALENQARAAGIFTDDIGRIVTNDYNTAGGIMAGYNLNKIDADTFDKRRNTIENTLGGKYGLSASQIEAAKNDPNYKGPGANLIERLGLLDESEKDIFDARKKTELVSKLRKDKKVAVAEAKAKAAAEAKKKKEEEQKRIAEAKKKTEADRKADTQRIQSRLDSGGYDSTSSRPDRDRSTVTKSSAAATKGVGGGGYTRSDSVRESQRGNYGGSSSPTNVGNPFGYMDGGRVYYMDGGLADLVDIYD